MSAQEGTSKRSVGIFGWIKRLIWLAFLAALAGAGYWFYQGQREVAVLKQIVSRLTSEERKAEVWVEEYQPADAERPGKVRLKILEHTSTGKKLDPIYCSFTLSDVIHFEALVIRLNDELIMQGKGKSVALFLMAYALDEKGDRYEKCTINQPQQVPGGYSLGSTDGYVTQVERNLWKSFWNYALDERRRQDAGIKTAQIEAPATRFVPEKIYTLVLEHDGGLRFQVGEVPEILKGEHVKLRTPEKTGEVPP